MANKFYITTPIYYVNDIPHIGHSYTTILADVFTRYHRMLGIPSYFLTGTDEHGQKVQKAAEKAGLSPQEQADRTVIRFQELWKKLNISNDDFIRTTELRHTAIVQNILQELYERDEIYKAEYDGWYCVPCERFYRDKDLADNENVCPECRRPVEKIKEANYFFKMSAYQEWLVSYINEHPGFIQPDFRRNETLGFLKQKLGDLCISRPKSRMAWGIELPFDPEYVTYVWFDALVNYISAVGYRKDEGMFKKWWPASCHLIGKDILTTHTVYWPTMLKALDLPLPETIFAHGWWLSGTAKMSKSLGNVVDPMDMIGAYGVDAFRYFLVSEAKLGQDASFTEGIFIDRYNSCLANDLGNALNRVMKLVGSHCQGRIPEPGTLGKDEERLAAAIQKVTEELPDNIKAMRLDATVAEISGIVRAMNQYLEKRQPWMLAKEGKQEAMGTVLYTAAETLRIVGGLLHPVMPEKMESLRASLGITGKAVQLDELKSWGGLPAGSKIGQMQVLFPRIDKKTKPQKEQGKTMEDKPAENLVDFDEFKKLQLCTAVIKKAETIEGTNKLLKLLIEVAGQERQLVAGIAQHYRPEELPGQEIIIVANLKPAKIRGVLSEGMLLAAVTTDGKLALVAPDKPVGSGVPVS